VPATKIVHEQGVSSASSPIFVEWHKHKGMMRFYRKFFRHEYPGALMWLVALGVWLRFSSVVAIKSLRRLTK
jgi:GT2 family glycosyltransferase